MKELTITLQTDSKIPLYEQIYDAIRKDILHGRILKGEKLPSTRFQAQYLQVSRSTVELAYEQLLSEGYIYSEPYRGYYACDVKDLYQLADLECKSDSGIGFSYQSVSKEKNKSTEIRMPHVHAEVERNIRNAADCRIDFSPNGIELSHFPFNALSKIMRNLILDQGEEMLKSSASFGDYNLRKSISEYLYRSRQVNCSPEQIVVGAGNEYLQILLSQILGTDGAVAMESPTYLQAYRTFSNLGYSIREIDVDKEGMNISQLEDSDAKIAYVMPSHQFPLGTVMSMKRRLEILNWAVKAPNRYIIEDDYDSEFRYKGKPIPALQGMDKAGRVIYLGTFSKSIAPSVRISYMVLPQELITKYKERCGFYSCTVPTLMQQSVYQFMQEGYFERNLNRMRGIYKAKHDFMLNELRKCPWVIQVMGGNAGLHFLVKVNTPKSEKDIIETCKAAGLRVYGISEYYIGKKSQYAKPMLVLGYGGLTEAQMKEGVELLSKELRY